MRYDNLPIYKVAMDFCVYIETIVKSFEKYNKYSIGQDLREYSKQILFLIHRANIKKDKEKSLKQLISNNYWSSTTNANNTNNAWNVNFNNGNTNNNNKNNNNNVRCVRAGE